MTSAPPNATAGGSAAGDRASPVAWHALPAAEVARRLETGLQQGLTAAEAGRRRAEVGDNVLRERPPERWWWKLLRQFQELVIWILIVAAVIAAVMGDWADATAIVAIVLVNAIIGFLQEERAQAALAALQRMSAPLAKVIRDGEARSIPAREVVPGDRIELEAGDAVPADARLVESFSLRMQESALTGESVPVDKDAAAELVADTPLGDRRTIAHAGTVVAAGHAAAVVVATGMETELGRIASLLEAGQPETTPLQRRLAELGRVLIAVCLVVVAVIFGLEVWRHGGLAAMWADGTFTEVLLRAVSLAVAAVPEGLPAVVTVVLAIGLQRMVARNALVRRLPSVETLGSVTVICSDKTGTLTRNEMTVREIVTAAGRWHVSGAGYAPQGEFHRQAAADGTRTNDLRDLIRGSVPQEHRGRTSAEYNARRIARDQLGSLNGQLTRKRYAIAGVARYRWRTMRDEAVRDAHADQEGKVFDVNGPGAVGAGVFGQDIHPGDDIQCRCRAVPVFDGEDEDAPSGAEVVEEAIDRRRAQLVETYGIEFVRKLEAKAARRSRR